MGCLKCLKVSTIPLALIIVIFYLIALASDYWSTCDKWNYNNGLWQKCVNDKCDRLYDENVQYRYRDARCNGKQNRFYTIDSTCLKYYRCLNGVYDGYNCSSGGQYNVNTDKCESPAPSGCIDIRCSGLVNKQYYRTDTICRNYYRCVDNVYESASCASNEYFDLSSKTCSNTKPTGCQDPKCRGVADGWYVTDVPTCKNYYVCTGGMLLDNQQCLSNNVANVDSKTCSGSATSNCKDPRCNGGDGHFVDSNHCTTYYTCTGGMRVGGSCPSQQYYDTVNKQCTSTRPNTCVDYRCHTHGMTTGTHVTDDTCVEYITCTSGAYTKTACPTTPNQKYYSTISSTCSTTVPGTCKDPKCNGKADGLYITDSPTCKNYYSCHSGGRLIDSLSCAGKTAVDTSGAQPTCKGTATVTGCKDPRCEGVSDGYYNKNNWCKDYYRCNGGMYTEHTCGAGTYFDTDSCKSTKPNTCHDERCADIGENGGYRVTDTTCSTWYRCNAGTYTTNTCANNEQFDVSGGNTCKSNTPAGCKDSRCDGKSNGYYTSDAPTCKAWFRCEDGIYTTSTCTGSTVFVISDDRQSGSCQGSTPSGSTTCKDPRCTSAAYHNWRSKQSGRCRLYFTCSGSFYTDRECPVYQYWDDANEKCTSTLPTDCRDQRCYGYSDGTYRMDTTCIDYFQCKNAETLKTGQCSSGTLFDQTTQSCVSAKNPTGCKVDGDYGTWTIWGACSVTTGFGIKTRMRFCNNPAPAYSGKNCDDLGPSTETTMCWVCPQDDWMTGARACMAMATVGAFLALVWSIILNCSTSRHPICTGGALFLLALVAGLAGLIVYHGNVKDVAGCTLETGYSMVLGWLGVVLAAIAFIIAMIAMCQAGESRVSTSDGIQMRTKPT